MHPASWSSKVDNNKHEQKILPLSKAQFLSNSFSRKKKTPKIRNRCTAPPDTHPRNTAMILHEKNLLHTKSSSPFRTTSRRAIKLSRLLRDSSPFKRTTHATTSQLAIKDKAQTSSAKFSQNFLRKIRSEGIALFRYKLCSFHAYTNHGLSLNSNCNFNYVEINCPSPLTRRFTTLR